jgi:hypothetical protein
VTYIPNQPASVNTTAAGDHEREFLTRGLNTAISRTRLTLNTLETIAYSLRHKQSTVAEVRAWLKDEGLDQVVKRHMPGAAK